MSRQIDLANLSREDVLYLQERGKRPADVEAIKVSPPEAVAVSDMPNTGDVGLRTDQSEVGGQAPPAFELEDNYEELGVDALKEEISRRNDAIEAANKEIEDEEEQIAELSTKGRKHELISRLRADDQRRAAAGEFEEEA